MHIHLKRQAQEKYSLIYGREMQECVLFSSARLYLKLVKPQASVL